MKTILLLPVLSLWLLLATQAHAQVYHLHLSDNTCRITECVDTPQGVKPLGQTWKGNTFHDRFTLDFDRTIFRWEKEGKETYANKIINHTAKYAHHSFTTEQITANLTINSHRAVLQLIHFQNGQWITSHLFLRDRELTASCEHLQHLPLYLIFVLFICE